LLGFLSLGLAACDEDDSAVFVSSVQPNFTELDLTTDGALPGTWSYEGELTLVFQSREQSQYDVVLEENENGKRRTSHFEGHLFRLGPDTFLDLYPTQLPDGSEFYQLHFFPSHTVAKIEFFGDEMRLTFLSAPWLSREIKDGAISLPHAITNGALLLTATTKEIQEVLSANSSNEQAFSEPIPFEQVTHEEER